MQLFVERFAEALKKIDSAQECYKSFRAGVGPFGEPQVVKKVVSYLANNYPSEYGKATTKRWPDIVIPGLWAIEVKLVRPFGDNGKIAEHWSENLLHPYVGNTSLIGDCLKLRALDGRECKGVCLITYEHNPAQINLDILINSFELIAKEIAGIPLSNRYVAEFKDLIHPIHQQGKVYGWKII